MRVRFAASGRERSLIRRSFLSLVLLSLGLFVSSRSAEAALGDVNLDGQVDAADVLLLERYLRGDVSLGYAALEAADVAPVVNGMASPDDQVNIGDLAVLTRIVGEVSVPGGGGAGLPAVPGAPTLTTPANPQICLNANPCTLVTGSGVSGNDVRLIVNGNAIDLEYAVVDGFGNFTINGLLFDGVNTIAAQQRDASGMWGDVSNEITLEYQNNIDKSNLPTTINSFVVWTEGDGAPYDFAQNLTIASGGRLVVMAGATVRFGANRQLVVAANGQLQTNGLPGDPAVLTSSSGSPTPGVWEGVLVSGAADVGLQGALIEYAWMALESTWCCDTPPGSFWMRDSVVRWFGYFGINFTRLANVEIRGSTFENTDSDTAIRLEYVSEAIISQNLITGTFTGLSFQGCTNLSSTTASVMDNEIVGNVRGIYIDDPGSCELTIRENQIHSNSQWNLMMELSSNNGTVIDAEANYWGSDLLVDIEAFILDRSDSLGAHSGAYVDFVPARAQDGALLSFPGTVTGPLWSGNPLEADTTYTVVGTVGVPSGESFTFPPNVTLVFPEDSWLEADGDVLGPATGPPTILTGAVAERGYWRGVHVYGGPSDLVFEGLEIEYAWRGIQLTLVGATDIDNVLIREFSETGIYLNNSFNVDIDIIDTTVDNSGGTRQGNCVYSNGVTFEITGSTLTGCVQGVLLDSTVGGLAVVNSAITGNDKGIVTNRVLFSVTQSDLSNNSLGALVFQDWFASQGGSPVSVSARQNWWGTLDPVEINDMIIIPDTGGEPRVRVDFSEPLDENGVAQTGLEYWTSIFSNVTFAPADRIFRPLLNEKGTVTFNIAQAADVTMKVCRELVDDACATPVLTTNHSYPAAGQYSLEWDGKDQAGNFVPDEAYFVKLEAVLAGGVLGGVYDRARGSDGFNDYSGGPAPAYNAYENDFWKMDLGVYTLVPGPPTTAFRTQIKVMNAGEDCDWRNHDTDDGFFIPDNRPIASTEGLVRFTWDGRDPSGNVVDGIRDICGAFPLAVKSNHFLVRGTVPAVGGSTQATAVEVKANPFLIRHSYDQTAGIVFSVDQNSVVDVMLLPPGTLDAANSLGFLTEPGGAAWTSRTVTAGVDYTAEWFGYTMSDTNSILTGAEGSHAFLIRATSQVTGVETTYYGVLQVRL